MAFIDWLRRQHEESERNRALFQGRPMVPASRAWGGGPGSGSGYQDRPGGQRLMVRQPRFKQPPPSSVTVTEKDDGSRTKVTKWEPEKQLKASGLGAEDIRSRGGPIPPPRNQRNPFDMPISSLPRTSQVDQIRQAIHEQPVPVRPPSRADQWAGTPWPSIRDQRRENQFLAGAQAPPRSLANMGQALPQNIINMDLRRRLEMPGQAESLARIPRQQMPPPHVPRMRGDIGAADSIGMPQVANLRNRVRGIERQQATIPRQQMPPPRFVPPVDPSQFPTVQDRGLGTYDTGEPGVQMSGDFDWTGRALRENLGEDFRNIGERYTNWWQNLVEESKRKRRRGNY